MYRVDVSHLYSQQQLSDQEAYVELQQPIKKLRERCKKRDLEGMKRKKIYMVSSSEANQGAVFELFPHQMRILEELQVDLEWWLLSVTDNSGKKQRFHELTRKIVNFVYGRNPLKQEVKFSDEEKDFFEEVVGESSQPFLQRLQRGDIVILHDPHPLPLVNIIRAKFTSTEVPCLWRCHIGLDFDTEETKSAWDFLRPYIERFDTTIFPLQEYAKSFCPNVRILRTAIHPTSERNRQLSATEAREILLQAGLLKERPRWLLDERYPDSARVFYAETQPIVQVTVQNRDSFEQLQQQISPIRRRISLIDTHNNDFVILRDTEECPDFGLTERPYLLQLNHWDSLKGFAELLKGFAELKRQPEKFIDAENSQHLRLVKNLALVLAGVQPKQDDVEGQELLTQLVASVKEEKELLGKDVLIVLLSDRQRQNLSFTVNALQSLAFAVVQNSLREGSGLSVLEAMWKQTPCIVSNACGLRQLITHEENGLVIEDPNDSNQVAASIGRMIMVKDRQKNLWLARAKQRVAKEYLMYYQLQLYLDYIRDARLLAKNSNINLTAANARPNSAMMLQRKDSIENRYIARMDILNLLVNNRKYVEKMIKKDALFFSRLSNVQTPEYLYIGCADSRVPANEILGLLPGEVFVHRNIAGLVVQSDFNMLSVLHYAVDYLRVKHVIVCGHYSCGGVRSTMLKEQNLGIFQNWTKHIVDLHDFYREELDGLPEARLLQKLCELNVMWQVKNLCQTTIVQGAWDRKQTLHVHGLIYDIADGLLLDMGMHIDDLTNARKFVERVWGKRFFPNCQTFISQIDEVNQDKLKYLADQLYL